MAVSKRAGDDKATAKKPGATKAAGKKKTTKTVGSTARRKSAVSGARKKKSARISATASAATTGQKQRKKTTKRKPKEQAADKRPNRPAEESVTNKTGQTGSGPSMGVERDVQNPAALFDPFNLVETFTKATISLMNKPERLFELQKQYVEDSMKLWNYAAQKAMGGEAEPVIKAQSDDRRWRDDDWQQSFVFDYIKQFYLLTSQSVMDTTQGIDDLAEADSAKLNFFTRLFVDAMSPTNFAATNPQVLRETVETQGQNLRDGIQNYLRDMEQGDGKLKIAMTDPDAFTLGENVASTPGKVVFENRMFQLLQYQASTDKVLERPLLIVPPWINKFYILDLQARNSFIKWAVDQGHTVFVVSWVNPDESYADVDFDDYITDGFYAAVDAVEKATGVDQINVIGYCIGGTLTAAALSHMKQRSDERVKSATFFTTMLDFSEPGDLGVFVDEVQVSNLEQLMDEKGYLDGSEMSATFNMLRSNDLIWSFYINNYLMGKDPAVFDLLYWNSDSTRLPARMHSTYLRKMYVENQLCQPKAMALAGEPIDLSSIDIPACFVSTIDDHIAPWKSTYAGANLLGGDVEFILGGSGHIAGVINPPVANKYGYSTNTGKLPGDADEWLAGTEKHEGSWWPHWHEWIGAQDANKTAKRVPGDGALKATEDAPGRYVKARI